MKNWYIPWIFCLTKYPDRVWQMKMCGVDFWFYPAERFMTIGVGYSD